MRYNCSNYPMKTALGVQPPHAVNHHRKDEFRMATSDSTSNPDACSIYVIQAASGAVKIGIAQDVKARLRELQTGNHEHLTTLYQLEFANREIAAALELVLHKRYTNHALRGEWFTVDTDRLINDILFAMTFAKLVKGMVIETSEKRHEYVVAKPQARRRMKSKAPKKLSRNEAVAAAWELFKERKALTISELAKGLNTDTETIDWAVMDLIHQDLIGSSSASPDMYALTERGFTLAMGE